MNIFELYLIKSVIFDYFVSHSLIEPYNRSKQMFIRKCQMGHEPILIEMG